MKFYVTIVLFWLNRFRPKVCRLCCRSVDDFHFFKSGHFMFSSSFFFRIIFQNFFIDFCLFSFTILLRNVCFASQVLRSSSLPLCKLLLSHSVALAWFLDKLFSLPIETNYHNFDRSLCLFLFFFRIFTLAISNCIAFDF